MFVPDTRLQAVTCQGVFVEKDISADSFVHDADGLYRLGGRVTAEEIVAQAVRILRTKFRRGTVVSTPKMMQDWLTVRLTDLEHEVFLVVFLDNRHRIIADEVMFRGTIDAASVSVREVLKEALKRNAAALIVAHCHPSGIPEPSADDRRITAKIKEALGYIDIRLLDHFVVGGGDIVSFAERGFI